MPTSQVSQISAIMRQIQNTQPQSVLDIGVGFGKYGFLCREYLELWDGREKYADWKRQIDGIEAFEEYVTPLQRAIYSNIFVGDALTIVPTLPTTYDLILLIDVIEHFSPKDGFAILKACAERGKNLLISTPKNCGPQKGAFGNPFETHRSQWVQEVFSALGYITLIPNDHSLICYVTVMPSRVAMFGPNATRNEFAAV